MKRVIIVPDFPPKRAISNVRESYQAAADRWDAELIWFSQCDSGGHCFWRKMRAFAAVLDRFDEAHVLQLDNDMLIREDCPSPFDLVSPDQFAMVAGRQRPDRRVDESSWGARAHRTWATRMNTDQLPPALHPNGGLYLYGLPHFLSVWQRIEKAQKRWSNYGDMGADESIIGNVLWSRCRDAIRFLPQEFNTVLCQNGWLLRDNFSPTYITHYAMGAKEKLAEANWRVTGWPWDNDDPVRNIAREVRRGKHKVGCLVSPDSDTACKLLILFPELQLFGIHANRRVGVLQDPDDVSMQLHASRTSYLLVRQILSALGPLARRYRPLFCDLSFAEELAGPFDFISEGSLQA
ncbi:hypothetical protein FYK55_18495 [Roseiconus nitratireducens]|uniref:Uncharacterized protein n=1 Tax=Roseiconus nitratireducens TaxID=2605748 RepID=A0A5M6D3U3_9BACT|nr:hypothetical protein [Roseiconus nitratireducens]KAA5541546.1 hypothetical protein FYK55_18495 [Roseiconus nitratireducens]